MSNPSLSTAEMIQALREHLEQRVRQSEDYRALVALDHHLAAYDDAGLTRRRGTASVAERRRHLRLLSFNRDPVSLFERGASRN